MLDTQVDVEQPSARKLLDMVFEHNSSTSRRVCALMLSTDDNRYAWRAGWVRNLDQGNRAAVLDFLAWVGDGGFLSDDQMTALQDRWEICGWGKVDDCDQQESPDSYEYLLKLANADTHVSRDIAAILLNTAGQKVSDTAVEISRLRYLSREQQTAVLEYIAWASSHSWPPQDDMDALYTRWCDKGWGNPK